MKEYESFNLTQPVWNWSYDLYQNMTLKGTDTPTMFNAQRSAKIIIKTDFTQNESNHHPVSFIFIGLVWIVS